MRALLWYGIASLLFSFLLAAEGRNHALVWCLGVSLTLWCLIGFVLLLKGLVVVAKRAVDKAAIATKKGAHKNDE